MHGSLKITRRRGGQVLSFVTGLIASVGASANPQGAQVAHGAASFAMPNARTLEITNSPAAVLNWRSFDIGHGETTRFIQQNAASSVLNRVTSGNSSEIFGNLVSNGRVFLINPTGILIGRDGSIDTAGVLLSTLRISDQDFLKGRLHFEGTASNGAITNHGYIKTAPGGEVVLLAPRIENSSEKGNAKSGIIESSNGELLLAAGTAITIASLDDPDISFDVKAPDNEVVNLGRLLSRGGTASILAGTIRHSGEINADSVGRNAAGRIVLKASDRIALDEGSRVHASGGSTADGGSVEISASGKSHDGQIDALGTIEADGLHGGKVQVRAESLLLDGLVSAQGASDGGALDIKSRDATIATVNAKLQASSTKGEGGSIQLDGGKSTFSSGSMNASGVNGGSVQILGDEVALAAGTVRASGHNGGGKVRVGGGFRGGEKLHAARKVQVNDTTTIKADALVRGDGGDVVVWSAGTTRFGGSISARGGASNGDGGRVEVSGLKGLGFSGEVSVTARHGDSGTLLLDPKNLRFTSDELPAAPTKLLDPHPGADNFFGSGGLAFFNAKGVRVNSSDGAATVVVHDSLDDFGGTDAGAVYLYRLSDGALLSELHGVNENLSGTTGGDRVGNSFIDSFTLSGVNLLRSAQWGGGAGALTVFDPVNGTSGGVTASNSLVGAAAGDSIGNSSFQFLNNKSVAVLSRFFDGNRGAITVVTPSTLRGTVSSSNSLVGANANDQLGDQLTDLGAGHWAARSANGGLGSLTVIHAGMPIAGVVSGSNSLVGSAAGDAVGNGGLFQLGNSKFWVATSSLWNGGVGAVTWVDRTGNIRGPLSASNSLVGSAVGDLGSNGAQFRNLSGANYLLFSDNGGAGAVTFVSPTSLPKGLANDPANSLVGSSSTDAIGHNSNGGRANFDFFNGKIAIYSPRWNGNAGAVTWGSLTSSLARGPVGASNSLLGANSDDFLGDSRIVPVGFGLGLLRSDNGGAGAVTVIDASAPAIGLVRSANSLVGGVSSDAVGGGADGIEFVGGSTYAIVSPNWSDPLGASNVGAVTLFDASTGKVNGTATPFAGLVSTSNSLVGINTDDQVGSGGVKFAYNGTSASFYAVLSPDWHNTPSVPGAGALTWFTLSDAVNGTVSVSNSLVGSSTGDNVGDGATSVSGLGSSDTGIYRLLGSTTQSAVYYNPDQANGAGAVVFLPGTGPPTGPITSANALLGGTTNDHIGSNGIFERGGKYIVLSPDWDNSSIADAGAVTVASADSGLSGFVGSINKTSLVGNHIDDHVGGGSSVFFSENDNVLIVSDQWNNNAGAVTFLDTTTGHFGGSVNGDLEGVLDETNSLVGRTANDRVGSAGFETSEAGLGYYLVFSPLVDTFTGAVNAGAVTVGDQVQGVRGFADDNTVSFVGTLANDGLGLNANVDSTTNNNLFLLNPQWHSNIGAATFVDLVNGTGLSGDISSANSVVGQVAGDNIGLGGVQMLTGHVLAIHSPNWSDSGAAIDAGALTWGNELTGVKGVVNGINGQSLVGANAGDAVGQTDLRFVSGTANLWYARTADFDGGKSAFTFFDPAVNTPTGLIGAANSLIGSTVNDRLGRNNNNNNDLVFTRSFGAITRVVVLSPDWDNGGTLDAGAITTFLPTAPVKGVLGAGNSLVGSHAGDGIGSGFEDVFSNGNRLFVHSDWNNGRGAITFWNGKGNLLGTVGPANSLVGAAAGDQVGSFASGQVFGTNQYMVRTPSFNNNAGSLTFGNITTGVRGIVGPGNSLVGAASGDRVGNNTPSDFGNGHLLLTSIHGTRGAVTFIDVKDAPIGVVGTANSLVGNRAGDALGSSQRFVKQGVQAIFSPDWDNGTVQDAGAITMIDMDTGNFLGTSTAFAGRINANNSLVGTFADDRVGGFAINRFGTVLSTFGTGETGAIFTPNWHQARGAITWFTPGQRVTGEIAPTNSLVGSFAGDQVGDGGFGNPIEFFNTASVIPPDTSAPAFAAVFTPNWNGTRGAITWFKPDQRPVGAVTAKNSLVGGFLGDFVGSELDESFSHGMMRLTSGNYVLFSTRFHEDAGAVTFLNVARGLPVGAINNGNSFVGNPGDFIGNGSAFALDGDRVLFSSSRASVDGLANAGRIDLLDGSKTQTVDAIDFRSNGADDLAVSIPAVVRFLNGGGALTLQASNDIFIPQGINILSTDKNGSLTLEAGRSIEVQGSIVSDGFVRLFANSPNGDAAQREAGDGSVSIVASTRPSFVIAERLEVDAQSVFVQGGSLKGAYAALYGRDSAKILAHGSGLVSLTAGTAAQGSLAPKASILNTLFDGTDSAAVSAPIATIFAGNTLAVNAEFIELNGGGSNGAFAAMATRGNLTVQTESIVAKGGTAAGAFAAVYGRNSAKIAALGTGLISLTAGTTVNGSLAPNAGVLNAMFDAAGTAMVNAPIAVILGGNTLDVDVQAIEISGGGSDGAFAALASRGNFTATTGSIVAKGGTAAGAFAAIYGAQGVAISSQEKSPNPLADVAAAAPAENLGVISLTAGTGVDVQPASALDLLSAFRPSDNQQNGGSVEAPIAVIISGNSLDVNFESIRLTGGGSAGAFAAIGAFGNLVTKATEIEMTLGTAANTDAVFLGLGGAADVSFTTCIGCNELLTDPLLDATSQSGTFVSGLLQDPTINGVLAMLNEGQHAKSDKEDADEKSEDEGASAECH